jgi:hypothetical protein
MNINLIQGDSTFPEWWWVVLISMLFSLLTFVGWAVFKFTNVSGNSPAMITFTDISKFENFIDERVGKRLSNIVQEAIQSWKPRREIKHVGNKGVDLEQGLVENEGMKSKQLNGAQGQQKTWVEAIPLVGLKRKHKNC